MDPFSSELKVPDDTNSVRVIVNKTENGHFLNYIELKGSFSSKTKLQKVNSPTETDTTYQVDG